MKILYVFVFTFLIFSSVNAKKNKNAGTDGQTFKLRNLAGINVKQPLTTYQECKQKCKQDRDAVQLDEYVQQLRSELLAAETILANQQAAETILPNQQADAPVQPVPVLVLDPMESRESGESAESLTTTMDKITRLTNDAVQVGEEVKDIIKESASQATKQ